MFTQKDIQLTEKQDFMLYLIPTYDCNFRCSYCFVPKDAWYKINLTTLEDIVSFLNTFINSNKIQIWILWWEPFLYKDLLLQTIQYLHDNVKHSNFSFYITTNWVLVDEKILQWMQTTGAKIEVAFSLDWNFETMNKNRIHAENSFISKKIFQNFLLAKKYLWRSWVSITMTISLETVRFFDSNLLYLFELNPYLLRFRLAAWQKWDTESMNLYLNSFKKLYIHYVYTLYVLWNLESIPMVEQFEYMIDIKKDNIWACSKWVNLTITPDGFFVPCYNFLTKEKQDLVKFPYDIHTLVRDKNLQNDFLEWRIQYYNFNNWYKDESWKPLIGRYNFSTCISWDFQNHEKEEVLNVWKYKEQREKMIGAEVFKFYFNQDINLYKRSLIYNK